MTLSIIREYLTGEPPCSERVLVVMTVASLIILITCAVIYTEQVNMYQLFTNTYEYLDCEVLVNVYIVMPVQMAVSNLTYVERCYFHPSVPSHLMLGAEPVVQTWLWIFMVASGVILLIGGCICIH